MNVVDDPKAARVQPLVPRQPSWAPSPTHGVGPKALVGAGAVLRWPTQPYEEGSGRRQP